MLQVGRKAPAFNLPNADGVKRSLKDYAGKSLLLYFYPKDMTPGCTVEAQRFQSKLAAIRRAGAEVVGVSKDSPARHRKFCDKEGLKFDLLSDESGAMLEKYGVWKEKSLYGRKFMGIVRSSYLIGPDGKVVKVYPKVKPKDHADEVLADLRGEAPPAKKKAKKKTAKKKAKKKTAKKKAKKKTAKKKAKKKTAKKKAKKKSTKKKAAKKAAKKKR